MTAINNDIKFEIKPLDINLAKLQFNLINRLKDALKEEKDFKLIEETYKSTIRDLNIDKVTAVCSSDNSKEINLTIKISDKNNNEQEILITKGDMQKILNTVKDKNFFITLKNAVVNIDNL